MAVDKDKDDMPNFVPFKMKKKIIQHYTLIIQFVVKK